MNNAEGVVERRFPFHTVTDFSFSFFEKIEKDNRQIKREIRFRRYRGRSLTNWGVFIQSILSDASDLVAVMLRDIYISAGGGQTLFPRKQ